MDQIITESKWEERVYLTDEEAMDMLPYASGYLLSTIKRDKITKTAINDRVFLVTKSGESALFDKEGNRLTPWFMSFSGFDGEEHQRTTLIEISIPYNHGIKYAIYSKGGNPIKTPLTTIRGLIDEMGNPISSFTDTKTGESYSSINGIESTISLITFGLNTQFNYNGSFEPTCGDYPSLDTIDCDSLDNDSLALRKPIRKDK